MEVFFTTKAGVQIPAVSASQFLDLWNRLISEYELLPAQLIESASYSMAMVVRFALGLSATGGKVMALAEDCPAGCVVLAALRHLENAGASTVATIVSDGAAVSSEFRRQVGQLERLGVPICVFDDLLSEQGRPMIDQCHNLLCGLARLDASPSPTVTSLCALLNEAKTPVHAVLIPPGVNANSGEPSGTPLYASSTLSLGVPLRGLREGREFAGRQYVCDISVPRTVAREVTGMDLSALFEAQPVTQIFPAAGAAGSP